MDRRVFIETLAAGAVAALSPIDLLASSAEGVVNGALQIDGQRFRGHLMTVDRPNSNKRMYPRAVVEEALRAISDSISQRAVFAAVEQTEIVVSFAKVCGLVTKIEFQGDQLFAEGEILKTPAAEIFKTGPLRMLPVGIGSVTVVSTSDMSESEIVKVLDYKFIALNILPANQGCIW